MAIIKNINISSLENLDDVLEQVEVNQEKSQHSNKRYPRYEETTYNDSKKISKVAVIPNQYSGPSDYFRD